MRLAHFKKYCSQWLIPLAALSLLVLSACYEGHGLEPPSGQPGIDGQVTLSGDLPDSTQQIVVVALRHFPHGITETQALISFMTQAYLTGDMILGDTLSRFTPVQAYHLDLAPGVWEWIVVAWFPRIDDYLTGVKELGAYTGSMDETAVPLAINIIEGSRLTDIDMHANLNHVHRTLPFFAWEGGRP